MTLLATTAAAAPAMAQPSWPTTWFSVGTCGESDPESTSPTTLDLVGAPGASAAYFAFDANYAYFRERIAVDPSTGPGQFINGSFVVLVKTATGDPFEYQYLIALDGNGDQVKLYQNDPLTAAPISFSPIFNDPAETQLYSASSTTLSRSISAGTSITGSANYFVDWAIPRSVLASNGIDPTTSLYWFATSSNSNNYNKGTLDCPFAPTTTLSMTKSSAPTSVSVGQTTPVTYTVTVSNTGTYIANGVAISDSGFPSWLTITNVASTLGTVSFTASSLQVQITTLPIGGSATVTVTASANPVSAGSFTNTASAYSTNADPVMASSTLTAAGATNTPTNTKTPTITSTPTSTFTQTHTFTASATSTPPNTGTATFTATPTATHTYTPTASATPSFSATPTVTSTWTFTPTVTATSTGTATSTPSDTPTFTATPEDTATATATETATATPEDTATATATASFTATETATPPDTATPTETDTPTVTETPTAIPTATATFTDTDTPTETPTPTATGTETATPSNTPTPTPYCGDGGLDAGETCDDGNTLDGDGCDATCLPSTACSFAHNGTQLYVGGCGAPSYGTIQAAVDAASDGDVVTVCAGSYTQPVLVTRQVRIQATPGTVSVHTSGTAFDIRRSGVQIEGLTIQADSGAAIVADAICPLGQPTCAQPAAGSNVSIINNTIQSSPVGVTWQRRIDCASITGNTMTSNQAHIELLQQEGPPAVLVSILANTLTGGGTRGAALRLSGLGAIVAANTVRQSAAAGLSLAAMPGGGVSQVVENDIDQNVGDGITVETGADGVGIHDNNITDNGVGLGNNSAGTVDARENWWDSQSGPSGVSWPNPEPGPALSGTGDSIVNRNGGTTFIEFLCKPFPAGFPSVMGICGTEVAELRQLVPGRHPDLDTFGRYIAFESTADLDVDIRTTQYNSDGNQEIFLLNRRPKKKLTGVCLGGLLTCNFNDLGNCAPCNGRKSCPGDASADPVVLDGECVVVTQLTDGSPTASSSLPRIGGSAKGITFATTATQNGNGDGSQEVVRWARKPFEKGTPPINALSVGAGSDVYDAPVPSQSVKQVVMESNANPTGGNPDGNTEIFIFYPRSNTWQQLTDTQPPVENRRPMTVKGKAIIFDSTGDLHTDPTLPGVNNQDGNREVFLARVRGSGVTIRQITDTVAPAESLSGSLDAKGSVLVFSSSGNLTGQNADANPEIFSWGKRSGALEQLTHSTGGENVNPSISMTQRFIVFESTADLTGSGATNRRIFQFDRLKGTLTLLSRSRFGTNQSPRIRKRRFVVWESTSDLTGANPANEWVVYLFDRKKE